jgi:hypothetical protein
MLTNHVACNVQISKPSSHSPGSRVHYCISTRMLLPPHKRSRHDTA